MNTISSVSSSTSYNPQLVNKVANVDSANLANNAANQSAFSSYIGQALAQIGIANPTNSTAPVVSGTNKAGAKEQDSQKAVSTFIQDLFTILSAEEDVQNPTPTVEQQQNQQEKNVAEQFFQSQNLALGADENSSEAIAAYTTQESTTVGHIVTNLQSLIKQLNDESLKTESDDTSALQRLERGFQYVLDAHGANSDNPATLGVFLQALAQNLEGQSPRGVIINTYG